MDNKKWSIRFALTKASLFLLIFCLLSCEQEADINKKVIVVHARGISYPDLAGYLPTAEAHSFFLRNNQAGNLHQLQPIVNAVTICNIASFETGTIPADHGIIGHVFGKKEDQGLKAVSGFSKRFALESFWETADRAGKKVLNVGALTLHGKYEQHSNVDCLAQGSQLSESEFLQLMPNEGPTDEGIVKLTIAQGSSASSLSGVMDTLAVYLKGAPLQDQVLVVDHDDLPDNGNLGEIKLGEWLEIEKVGSDPLKEAFRIKWLSTQNDTVHLYVRGVFTNRGYPNNFLQKVEEKVGASKGWPGIPLFSSGLIDGSTLIEEISTELDYVVDVFSQATQEKSYDLIMLDYPLMDRLGHAFLQLRDTSKPVQDYFQTALNRMDQDFAFIEKFAGENGYELIINSGHGFSPIHTSVDINKLLDVNGLNVNLEETTWEAVGVPGKVSAHVYINDQLNESKKQSILESVEEIFQELNAPGHDEGLLDTIYRKEDLDEIGMNHKNAGDLFIMLKPGYVFQNTGGDATNIFDTPTFKGDHGYSLKHEASYGILISHERCDPCRSIDIAKMITGKLGIDD